MVELIKIDMELTLSGFFLDIPLYTQIKINTENEVAVLKEILYSNFGLREFEGFNPSTKLSTTYRITSGFPPLEKVFIQHGGITRIIIKCKRNDIEFQFFAHWNPETSIFMKVGQLPSVADFHINEIKQYKKVLTSEKLKEFTRAIGIAANGVGIGSFVYLRRVFEYLVNEAYQKAKLDKKVTDEDYQSARMVEKIDLLSDYLPNFLVENKNLYGILSLGIHELDEDDCLKHFDLLRISIEIILDEKLDEYLKQVKIEKAKLEIEKAKSELSNKSDKTNPQK